MVVVMQERASEDQIQHVIATLVERNFDVHRSTGALKTVLGAVGGNREFDTGPIEVMDGVQQVLRITEPYKLASRTFKPTSTVVSLGGFRVGGRRGYRDGRAVLGRDRGTGRYGGGDGSQGGCQDAARGSLQAQELALQLPGPWRGGAADAARRLRHGTT